MAGPANTTLLSSLRRTVSAADFGAVGDGTTDDTSALQSAFNWLVVNGGSFGGTFIEIPPGRYKVTSPLTVTYNATNNTAGAGILGHGAVLTNGMTVANSTLLTISATNAANVRFFTVDGLSLDGAGGASGSIGLVLQANTGSENLYNVCLRDVTIDHFSGDGCQFIGNVFESQLMNSYFRDNNNGLTFTNTASGVISTINLFGCVFGNNAAAGVLTNAQSGGAPTDIGWHGCYFLLNGTYGANVPNGFQLMSHCGFENNWTSAASLQPGNAAVNFQNLGFMYACTGGGTNGKQSYMASGFVTSTFAMHGCQVDSTFGMKLSNLNGSSTSKASIISCRGGRDYGGTYLSNTTELADINS